MANLVWPICIEGVGGQSVDAVFLFFSLTGVFHSLLNIPARLAPAVYFFKS